MAKTIASLSTLSTTLASTDYFIVHNSSGDFKVPYSEIDKSVDHNCIFRGKSLGTVTASNIDTWITTYGISDATFTNIYPGDYFVISYPVPTTDSDGNTTTTATNKTIRVLGLNTLKYTGDTSLTTNHIVCAPDSYLFTHNMNSTATTGVSANTENGSTYGAYYGSDMHQIVIPQIDEALYDIFGSHLIEHRELFATAIDENQVSRGNTGWNGASTARAWFDCKSCLMSEMDVYGAPAWGSSGFDTGIYRQMPMYKLNPMYINNARTWFWLRDVADATRFCGCNYGGYANCYPATYVYSVRPRFLIG